MFERYLHVTGIPAFTIRNDGRIFVDALWARDLSRHTYLGSTVRVLCPMETVDAPPPGTVQFEQEGFHFVGLPRATSVTRYIATGGWFRAMWTMWRELRWPDLAFLGFVEHPIPYGWTAAPAARLRGVPWYTFIESTPWRVPTGVQPKWRHRLRASVAERVNRRLFRWAAFAFISQPAYASFLSVDCPRLVSPASWFVREELASAAEINQARALAKGRAPHLIFVGRLDPGKGVETLLQALSVLDRPGVELVFTVLGSGQLRSSVEQAAATLQHVQLVLGAPVPYGPEYFGVLRSADVLVVPNLGDEQPRNVFDAFAQGVPVLASDTTGLRSIVDDGITGRLVPLGDAPALAEAIADLLRRETRGTWLSYGDAGRQVASSYNHDDMHAQRAAFVAHLQAGGLSRRGSSRRTVQPFDVSATRATPSG